MVTPSDRRQQARLDATALRSQPHSKGAAAGSQTAQRQNSTSRALYGYQKTDFIICLGWHACPYTSAALLPATPRHATPLDRLRGGLARNCPAWCGVAYPAVGRRQDSVPSASAAGAAKQRGAHVARTRRSSFTIIGLNLDSRVHCCEEIAFLTRKTIIVTMKWASGCGRVGMGSCHRAWVRIPALRIFFSSELVSSMTKGRRAFHCH